MTDTPQGPDWWQAADGKWYAPDQPPAPGWWRASDGNWYPPAEATPEAPPPAETPAANATQPLSSPPQVPPANVPAAAAAGKSRKGLVIALAIVAVLVLVVVVGAVVVRRNSSDTVAVGGASAGANGGAAGGSGSGGDAGGSGGATAVPDDGPGKDITLADDVVVVKGNGGKAIKSFSDDGKTIVLDAGADGIDKLSQGKVLLLTGVTAVRVESLEKTGDGVSITTSPATLPEVVKDGEQSWDTKVNADAGKFHMIEGGTADGGGGSSGDGSAGGRSSGGGGTSESTVPDITGPDGPDINGGITGEDSAPSASAQVVSFVPDGPAAERSGIPRLAAAGQTISGKVGPMAGEITYEPAGSGSHLHVKLTSTSDVSGTIDIDVKVKSLNNKGRFKVQGSKTDEFNFDMDDLSGDMVVETDLKGLQNVATIKIPPFFKLPFAVDFPAPVGGIPFTLSLSGSIQVNLSMALNQAALKGRAEISFSGNAGFDFKGGKATLNGTRVQDAPDLLKTVQGIANGPVGVVITTELPKVGFGFSFLQTGAEVYISNGAVASQTMLPPPAQCTAMNVAYVLAGGVSAKFLGKEFDIARKPFVQKEWNYQAPADKRCNATK